MEQAGNEKRSKMAKIPLIQITRVDLKPLKSSVDRLGDLIEEYLEISGLRQMARDLDRCVEAVALRTAGLRTSATSA